MLERVNQEYFVSLTWWSHEYKSTGDTWYLMAGCLSIFINLLFSILSMMIDSSPVWPWGLWMYSSEFGLAWWVWFGFIFSLILTPWLKYFIFLPCLQLYASASASEVKSVRAALLAQFEEVKLKQQLQFQEEIELLKCQSEVLLEQQISQLKVGPGENALLRKHLGVFFAEKEKLM